MPDGMATSGLGGCSVDPRNRTSRVHVITRTIGGVNSGSNSNSGAGNTGNGGTANILDGANDTIATINLTIIILNTTNKISFTLHHGHS